MRKNYWPLVSFLGVLWKSQEGWGQKCEGIPLPIDERVMWQNLDTSTTVRLTASKREGPGLPAVSSLLLTTDHHSSRDMHLANLQDNVYRCYGIVNCWYKSKNNTSCSRRLVAKIHSLCTAIPMNVQHAQPSLNRSPIGGYHWYEWIY